MRKPGNGAQEARDSGCVLGCSRGRDGAEHGQGDQLVPPVAIAPGKATPGPFSAAPKSALACRMQKLVTLPGYSRGCHVITRPLLQHLPELSEFEVGMANLFGAPQA